jgi:hypothetical protein
MPVSMKYPLLAVSIASLWLGMGSLHVLHVPTALSPFDWLRPLPGFRSMGVTGRYWGFLALPLSLLGAAALYRYVAERRPPGNLRAVLLFAVLLQLGFQATTVLRDWLPSPRVNNTGTPVAFSPEGETISFGYRTRRQLQAALITPRYGIINCYDMDGFLRAPMEPGADLIRSITTASSTIAHPPFLQARFMTWNRIRISPDRSSPLTAGSGNERSEIVLNQAYHRHWQSRSCLVGQTAQGNLTLNCTTAQLAHETIDLSFNDPVSDLGVRVSAVAWLAWLFLTASLLVVIRLRARTLAKTSRDRISLSV